MSDYDLCGLAYSKSSGGVARFIKRFLDTTEKSSLLWTSLKDKLTESFGHPFDKRSCLRRLRRVVQRPQQNIRSYAEVILEIAGDAFTEEEITSAELLSQQLTDIFIDGLYDNQLKLKLISEEFSHIHAAVDRAIKEENKARMIHARLRTDSAKSNNIQYVSRVSENNNGRQGGRSSSDRFVSQAWNRGDNSRGISFHNRVRGGNKVEPATRPVITPQVRGRVEQGRYRPHDRNTSSESTYTDKKNIRCFSCGLFGHISRFCRNNLN